ncbi:MAG TPA: tripartite tricarboxylate transporter substrate binding protein [Burkholderiales bacterium]|nr:tripartite tricarboxylate transporter substrate binding protein [Burkholderiales bacterium]
MAASLAAGWSGMAAAESFPTKPIRWIVPFPPGGSNDVLGRYLGQKLTERLNEQVVIDNRGGANGIIGTELASRAPADGYTLLMISTSYVMNSAVRSLPYDVVKSFDPIAMIGSSPNCIITSPASGITSVADLVQKAKAKPGSINYASTGVGGFNHFGGELFKKVAGVNLVHVPYKGGGPAMTDVMANQVPIMFSSLTQALPNARSGRFKLLAVGAQKRSPAAPDVPTVAESGFPGYDVAVWWGVVAPAGVSKVARQRLQREFAAILENPETKKRLLADAAEPRMMQPEDIRGLIVADRKKWSEVARVANIKVESAVAAR